MQKPTAYWELDSFVMLLISDDYTAYSRSIKRRVIPTSAHKGTVNYKKHKAASAAAPLLLSGLSMVLLWIRY